jgi:cell division transport system permease protein
MAFPYPIRLAVKSLTKDICINFLSTVTIAVALLIVSLTFFVAYNFDSATKRLPERFSLNVYFDNDLSKTEIDSVIKRLRKNGLVHSIRYISKKDALKALRTSLEDSDYIFEGLNDNPLPDSVEVKLIDSAVGPEKVKVFVSDLLKIKGVSEVDYGEKFLSTIKNLKIGLNTIGFVLALAMSTGIIFVCYSTVKILFFKRNEEIETLKLLGATKSFIRIPFFIEGALIGTSAGALSLAGIYAFYYFFVQKMSVTMPIFKLLIFPADLFLTLPLIGLFLGLTGAAFALGRIKY